MTSYTYGRAILILAVGLALLMAGCRKPGPGSYDPRTDPLVNPPSLLEPPPEDISKIATDETLYITLRANPNTLNPLFVSSVFDFLVVDTLYTGLYTFGKDLIWRVSEETVESFEESKDQEGDEELPLAVTIAVIVVVVILIIVAILVFKKG